MHGAAEPRARGRAAVAPVRGPLRAHVPQPADPVPPRQALIALGKALEEPAGSPQDNTKIPAGLHLPRPVHRPRHHLRPGLEAAAVQRPRRAGRLPHPALRPRLALRPRPRREPVPVRVAEPRDARRQAARRANPPPDRRRARPRPPGPAPQRAGPALIGDPRNDENIIIGQLHLAFIKFHDRVVDRVKADKGLSGPALFDEASRLVRWHYQWVVVQDFLRRVAGDAVVADILEETPRRPGRPSTSSSSSGRTTRSCRSSSRSPPTASATP